MSQASDNPGARLKRARQRRKITLQKAAKQVGLPVETLKAIEAWDEARMPPKGYVPGILIKYAKSLGVNPNRIKLDLPETATPLRRQRYRPKRTFVLSRAARFGITAVVLSVIAGYVLWQFITLVGSPGLEVFEPLNLSRAESDQVVVRGTVKNDVSVFVNGEVVTVNEDNVFETTLFLEPGRNEIEVRALNNFSREATLERTVFYQPSTPEESVDEQG